MMTMLIDDGVDDLLDKSVVVPYDLSADARSAALETRLALQTWYTEILTQYVLLVYLISVFYYMSLFSYYR